MSTLENVPAPNTPYFTPAQNPPAGTALLKQGEKDVPKLFRPLKVKGVLFPNRIMLSPLCQYSAENGEVTEWHHTHIGGIAQRGPGITCVEASGVTANGRITPQDAGIWNDAQAEKWRGIVEFAHSQNQKIIIQLAHAGRKASTVAPWLGGSVAGPELGGWPDDVWAPSAIQWNKDHAQPKELSIQQIEEIKDAFVAAAKRAIRVGFDAVEIHSAHGYLLHEFLSPVSNQRTDKYGGSFENRTRFVLEVVEAVRNAIPASSPLFLRLSATDYLEEQSDIPESWTVEQSVKLAPLLAEKGVDILDVSAGGNHPRQHPHVGPAYQSPAAIAIKKAVGDKLVVGTVGSVSSATLANDLLTTQGGLDFVAVGRAFQKNPGLVFAWADELGADVRMPNQIRWAFAGRGTASGTPAIDVPELIETR